MEPFGNGVFYVLKKGEKSLHVSCYNFYFRLFACRMFKFKNVFVRESSIVRLT
ncbi:hypothetical protein SpiGrapes_1076 [Sphaerochaeta pleomorpha str. Grapes]|uniref:Uncharacterized protein n=1 Tax=Sphaerochaeta pleomorpha (strain ATCC BAA-1885 / DSM 22778 / Grapes) TaxID=158190 RepID=G8QS38_SPHPG|nr:hypothetical protein SpiGrapes_1076 [Sphaerochaeta pleomorpha str. Grapes]